MASPAVMAATTVVALLLLAGFGCPVLSGGGACLWDSYANCYRRAPGEVFDRRRAARREGDITSEAFAEARSSPDYGEGSPPAPSTGGERRAAVGCGNIYPVGGLSFRSFSAADHYRSAPAKTVADTAMETPGFNTGSRRRSLGLRRGDLRPPSPKLNTRPYYRWRRVPPPPVV